MLQRVIGNFVARNMGNSVATEAIKGVRFLRNTCANGLKEHVGDPSPTEPTPLLQSVVSSPEPPPSALIRNSVVRKALRRPPKGIKKNRSVSLDWEDLDCAMLLDKVGEHVLVRLKVEILRLEQVCMESPGVCTKALESSPPRG